MLLLKSILIDLSIFQFEELLLPSCIQFVENNDC